MTMKRLLFRFVRRVFHSEIDGIFNDGMEKGKWLGAEDRANKIANKLLDMGLDATDVADVTMLGDAIINGILVNRQPGRRSEADACLAV